MASLTSLANVVGTDKGTQTGVAHGYTLVYDMLLAPLRSQSPMRLLEMGLAIGGPELDGDPDREVTGSPSVDMWLEFFEGADVVGFDICDFEQLQTGRFTFQRGDSGNRPDVERLRDLGPYDVILDDASHASFHQQLGLATLFESLQPGGLYVIEDLNWQPEAFERELPAVPLTKLLLADFATTGRCPRTAAIPDERALALEREVANIILFDESTLNAMRDSYNARRGLRRVGTAGWRGQSTAARLVSPRFWLFNGRRFTQALTGVENINWQSVKLAVIQRALSC